MGDYIKDLRKLVGNTPLQQCGASVIIENKKGEILLQLRSDNGEWAYAGGAVELYERVEEAAAREMKEETGLIADELEFLGVFSGQEMRYTYPNGDQVSNIDIVFICRNYHGKLCCGQGEVKELSFFSLDQLPTPLFSANQPGISAYLKLRETQGKDHCDQS